MKQYNMLLQLFFSTSLVLHKRWVSGFRYERNRNCFLFFKRIPFIEFCQLSRHSRQNREIVNQWIHKEKFTWIHNKNFYFHEEKKNVFLFSTQKDPRSRSVLSKWISSFMYFWIIAKSSLCFLFVLLFSFWKYLDDDLLWQNK